MSIPLPVFNPKPYVHQTKKACIEAGLPLKASVVPKSPVKKSLGISRRSKKATSVSFLEQSENHLSIIYDPTNEKTYLEQCFYDIKLIGEGSFGVVFSVRFREDDQLYAIKKSKSPFYSNNDKRTKLEEVRKHEMIPKHPNCVQLYSSWVEDNFLYLQLELCDTSLEHYASENHNISEQTLWNILADMLLAVKNLHDRNLIHLDIKLENILMCSNGIYKLADFGLVSDINQIKGDTLEGDQKYLAPELLTGHFTKAADIFSLGIVMLELACDLLLPSNGILWQELRNDIFPDTCIENIPHELFNVIKKMMHSDHLKRPCVDDLLQIDIIQTILAQRKTGQSQLYVPLEFEQRMGITAVLQVEQGPQTSQLQQNDDDSVDNKTTPKGQDLSVISHLHNVVSSTPNHHSRTEQQWKLNVEISPIEQSDLVAPLCDCSGRWISKRRSEKNSVNIQPTPKTSFKKSRINTGNGSVGRRLF